MTAEGVGREPAGGSYEATMGLAYWSEHIRPTLGDLPIPGLRFLRDRYIKDVAANPEARRQIVAWWFSSPFAAPRRGPCGRCEASGEIDREPAGVTTCPDE